MKHKAEFKILNILCPSKPWADYTDSLAQPGLPLEEVGTAWGLEEGLACLDSKTKRSSLYGY